MTKKTISKKTLSRQKSTLLSAKELEMNLQKNVDDILLIDVRTPVEYASGHIPGALNAPLDELASAKATLLSHIHQSVFYCRTGKRSDKAASLFPKGKQPSQLEGGIVAWRENGGKIYVRSKVWDIERQVRFTAGLFILGGILASLYFTHYFLIISGFIGAGLVYSALSNTCGMGSALMCLPYNKKEKFSLKRFEQSLKKN